jgi:hypothetical protein
MHYGRWHIFSSSGNGEVAIKNMRSLVLLIISCGCAFAQCAISITSPVTGTYSGSISLSATSTSCPSVVRHEWRIYGMPLIGDGTTAYSYATPICSAASCKSTYISPFGTPYNVSYNWDGVYPLTVQALDSSGAVLATSAPVNITVADSISNIGGVTCTLTSPNLAVAQSGTITITVHCPGASGAGVFQDGRYSLVVDGQDFGYQFIGGYADHSWTYDTKQLEDGTSHIVAIGIFSGGGAGTVITPFTGAWGVMTTANGAVPRELRLNASTVQLWLGGTNTFTLVPRIGNCDNSESATTATYVSANPAVATVGASSGVITGIAAGATTITATASGGKTRTIYVSVSPGTPAFPHFGSDGSLCTAYNQGNCAPGKSLLVRNIFDSNNAAANSLSISQAHVANGFNVVQWSIYQSPIDQGYASVANWSQNFDQVTPSGLAHIFTGGFKAILGSTGMGPNGGENYLQASADSGFAARFSHWAAALQGKLIGVVWGDELSLQQIPNGGNGQITTLTSGTGPTQIVVSGGTATMTWPVFIGTSRRIDITGADNTCFNGTQIVLTGGGSPFTFPTSCANGTYSPTGPTIEAHLTVQMYNSCVPGVQNCQSYGPLGNTFPITNGSVPYIHDNSGNHSIAVSSGTAKIYPVGFDSDANTLQVDIASATNTCLNGTNMAMTRVSDSGGVGFTWSTSCGNGTYAPSGGTISESTATIHMHCTSCSVTGTLNRAVPNSIINTIRNALLSATPPIQNDWPWQGGAGCNAWATSQGNTGFNDVYWTWDGPESDAENHGWPNGRLVRSLLLQMENHYWTQVWPCVDHTKPLFLLTQGNGPWYVRGGQSYTLGATTGAQFTTTTPNNAALGAKVTVVGANCTANFTSSVGTGFVGVIASIQSSTTFTTNGSPACSSSGGTVYIASTNQYFTPPMDRLKFPGFRGKEIVAQHWAMIEMGGAGTREFNYQQVGSSNDYPTTAPLNLYIGNGPPDNPNGENDNVGLTVNFADNPSAQERWQAIGLTNKLQQALEPEIIQPVCTAPDLGLHIHTGARCGSLGTLIIAINDFEGPATIKFPSSLWSVYNVGLAPVTRLQEVNAAYVTVSNLAANSTSDSVVATGGEVVLWWFPAGATPLAQPASIGFNPASVGATQTAVRYSYLCNPATFASNLDQQATRQIFTAATSISLFKAPGPICYDYVYLDNSNVPVGMKSNVQVLP